MSYLGEKETRLTRKELQEDPGNVPSSLEKSLLFALSDSCCAFVLYLLRKKEEEAVKPWPLWLEGQSTPFKQEEKKRGSLSPVKNSRGARRSKSGKQPEHNKRGGERLNKFVKVPPHQPRWQAVFDWDGKRERLSFTFRYYVVYCSEVAKKGL